MPKPNITFADLRRLLLDLGFDEVVDPQSHVGFYHEASGAEIVLPFYRPNQIVMPHHLLTVRIMLDGKELMDERRFDDWVRSTKYCCSLASFYAFRCLTNGISMMYMSQSAEVKDLP